VLDGDEWPVIKALVLGPGTGPGTNPGTGPATGPGTGIYMI
jgi:hypothetical protein